MQYITAKRKTSIARCYTYNGPNILINGRKASEFDIDLSRRIEVLGHNIGSTIGHFKCYVKGGGLRSQADAIFNGLCLLLADANPAKKHLIRQFGTLTRDTRIVERKKYGKHKARKGLPFKKR